MFGHCCPEVSDVSKYYRNQFFHILNKIRDETTPSNVVEQGFQSILSFNRICFLSKRLRTSQHKEVASLPGTVVRGHGRMHGWGKRGWRNDQHWRAQQEYVSTFSPVVVAIRVLLHRRFKCAHVLFWWCARVQWQASVVMYYHVGVLVLFYAPSYYRLSNVRCHISSETLLKRLFIDLSKYLSPSTKFFLIFVGCVTENIVLGVYHFLILDS